MNDLLSGDLKIDWVGGPQQSVIRLDWSGKSNDRHPDAVLRPYFATVLAEAVALQAAVEMHFEKLDHFNSSTITSIIQLVQDARRHRVRLVLVYDQNLKWQKLSFDALGVLSKGDDLLILRAA